MLRDRQQKVNKWALQPYYFTAAIKQVVLKYFDLPFIFYLIYICMITIDNMNGNLNLTNWRT